MAKRKSKKLALNAGTAWFLALLVIALIGAFVQNSIDPTIVYLILGICGAMVAIYNVRFDEEVTFLTAIAALFIVLIAWNVTGMFALIGSTELASFLINIMVGLGVSGFIVSISLIFKIAIDK